MAQTICSTQNGMVFSPMKECDSDTRCNVDDLKVDANVLMK